MLVLPPDVGSKSMTTSPKITTGPDESAAPAAVESWENEGGHFPVLSSVAIEPNDVSSLVRDQAAESEALAAMRAKFGFDFSHGLMGQHHNTFQHRQRILRQLEARSVPQP
jgi:hypothetical protein